MPSKDWKVAEKKYAKRSGGQLVKGSGCGKHQKGDVKTLTSLVELKSSRRSTSKGYYIILQKNFFYKIVRQAYDRKRDPIVAVGLGNPYKYFTFTYGHWEADAIRRERIIPEHYLAKSITLYLSELEQVEESWLFVEDQGGFWRIRRDYAV